jgi:F-type H+-transporting ATPase subunit b
MLAFPPDITFYIQLGSYFVLLFILNRLLFVPYAELLAERDARTEGASRGAVAERAEADELAAKIEVEMSAARTAAAEEAEKIRVGTRGEESEIFAAAAAAAATTLVQLRAEIEKETAGARDSLRSDAKALAGEMTDAILGGGQG